MEPVYLLRHLEREHHRLQDTGQVFHLRNRGCDRVAVIVEPRRMDMLLWVIRNVMDHLGDGWNLHLFTSPRNLAWLEGALAGCSFRVTLLDKDNLTREEYSTLLMNPGFWDRIPEEHVLVFQSDCMLFRRGLDPWVDRFAYAGANYYHPDHVAPRIGGIQGGLSLRRKSDMLDCIARVSATSIQVYRAQHGLPPLHGDVIAEDIFFTHACEMLQKSVPTVEERRKLFIEADFDAGAFGHHGLQCPYFTAEQQRALLTHTEVV